MSEVLPAGVSRTGPRGPSDLNPRQRLERPLSLTTRLRERPGSVRDPLFEPFCESRSARGRSEAPMRSLSMFDP